MTLRAVAGLPSLRGGGPFGAVRAALAAASSGVFRVVHFSVQSDHVHLLVESDSHAALCRGVQGLAIRVAKAVNRALRRRGTVWGDRYHARLLATPREIRNALVYVLQNWRRHLRGARGLDPRSSAVWFSGWRTPVVVVTGAVPVVAARTWLARVGWQRYGPLGVEEAPRGASGERVVHPRLRRGRYH